MPQMRTLVSSPSTSTGDRPMMMQISWISSTRWPCNTLTSLHSINSVRKSSLVMSFSRALDLLETSSAVGSWSSHPPRTASTFVRDLTFSSLGCAPKSETCQMKSSPQMWIRSRLRSRRKIRTWMRNSFASGPMSSVLIVINSIDKKRKLPCLNPLRKLSFKHTSRNFSSSQTVLIVWTCTGTRSLISRGPKMVLLPKRTRKKLKQRRPKKRAKRRQRNQRNPKLSLLMKQSWNTRVWVNLKRPSVCL